MYIYCSIVYVNDSIFDDYEDIIMKTYKTDIIVEDSNIYNDTGSSTACDFCFNEYINFETMFETVQIVILQLEDPIFHYMMVYSIQFIHIKMIIIHYMMILIFQIIYKVHIHRFFI